MGTGESKHENVVADTIDRSLNLSIDFTVLRLHGDSGALINGSLANFLLLYIIYRGVLWKRSRMFRAREEAEDRPHAVWAGPGRVVRKAPPVFAGQEVCEFEEGPRAVWGGPWRVVQRATPVFADHEICEVCRGGPPQDMLQGHFQPA